MTITITKTIDSDDFWATPEEFANMTDAEIVKLFQEDVFSLLEGACWSVERDTVEAHPVDEEFIHVD